MVDARPTETPLRRSVVGRFRDSVAGVQAMTPINDDEEERRQARRRTLMRDSTTSVETTAIEDNETLKKCMEIYNGNKLSRDNAWNLSLIDTLSNLLDRHHKSLNNFKVAGSSLEASSKVYGLRVDSIYTDVLRMSAGLNAKKFNEKLINLDDDDETGNQQSADTHAAEGEEGVAAATQEKPKPKKRARKAVSSVTKNKDSLNARLDTVPLQDPIFGKLNTIVGSINASNRLMNNILPTKDSELLLRTNYKFWDDNDLQEGINYLEEVQPTSYEPDQWMNAEWAVKLQRYEQLPLRPMHSGYIITDLPNPTNSPTADNELLPDDNVDTHHGDLDFYQNPKEISMAFDINAECEPVPELDAQPLMLEIDANDYEEMNNDDRTVLAYCRGLRKQPVVIEDLRPVDANSKLEYSYRPMDKISQFWAGPSHWKFKRTRPRNTTLGPQPSNVPGGSRQSGRRAQNMQAKRRTKQLNFGEFHDENFIKLDGNTKLRKANIHKKWDARKLKLPTNLKIDKNLFFKYEFAPGLKVPMAGGSGDDDAYADDDGMAYNGFDDNGVAGDDVNPSESMPITPNFDATGGNMMNVSTIPGTSCSGVGAPELADVDMLANTNNIGNETVLEIATEFEGAPTQVTKVIVPFARRAKVIDMKNLKRCCSQLISKQMMTPVETTTIPQHPTISGEKYAAGMASFIDVYHHLPEVVTTNMVESLSTSVALYSVLHLANEQNLRLIPQDDLEDFKIRQVLE